MKKYICIMQSGVPRFGQKNVSPEKPRKKAQPLRIHLILCRYKKQSPTQRCVDITLRRYYNTSLNDQRPRM